MLTLVESPLLRSELSEKRMIYLKHIHGIKARVQTLIALIVRYRVKHRIIHNLVVVTMQCLSHQEEIRL